MLNATAPKEAEDAAPGPENAGPPPEREAVPLAGRAPGFALPAPAYNIVSAEAFAGPPALSGARNEIRRLNASAIAQFAAKDHPAALELLARVVNLDPDSFVAHGNYAVVLKLVRRTAEAEAHSRRALALNPNYIQGYKLLAELLTDRRDLDGALAAYGRLTDLEPENAASHNNTGLLLRKLGKLEEAQAAFLRASALQPDEPRIRFNLLMMQRDDAVLEEAMAWCRRSLAERPDNIDVLTNLAVCLQFTGRYDEALDCFERAAALDAGHREVGFNLSLLRLLRGDYARGWGEYEQRWRLVEVVKPNFPQPEWSGEDLAGRTILLQCEQGLGDTIQCLRYVPMVAARGARVVLRVARSLVRLAASLPGNIAIVPAGVPAPAFDVWCPLLSLPGRFGTLTDTIPPAPYLRARPAIVDRWQRRLGGFEGLKVGLVWAGSSEHINDFRRSTSLDLLRPLLEQKRASFFSLQVGPKAGDLAQLPSGKITDLSAELSDFAETAGAILNLDLVIAVDTAVVHLAGALGARAWVMLPFSPDWRWMLERDDSLWYPSLRLYRQRAPSDWDGVIARIATDLAGLVAGRKPM